MENISKQLDKMKKSFDAITLSAGKAEKAISISRKCGHQSVEWYSTGVQRHPHGQSAGHDNRHL